MMAEGPTDSSAAQWRAREYEGVVVELVVGHSPRMVHGAPGLGSQADDPPRERWTWLYELMRLARTLDERQWILNRQGLQPLVVSCQGHEAAQVGSAAVLRPGIDLVAPYYRDLAAMLTLGVSPREVLLEALGRAEGPWTGGRQMPAHYGDPRLKILSSSSAVATQIAHAAGAALASKLRGDDAVTLCYFGDGAVSKGDFHESLNFAAIRRLPVIYFCENNGLAISTPLSEQSPVPGVAARAAAYGIPGVTVDGCDPLAVYRTTRQAAARARRGEGPTLIEARVVRLAPHTSDDDQSRYRSAAELAAARARDPLPRFASRLREEGLLDDERDAEIGGQVRRAVEEALEYAQAAPTPAPETATAHLFRDVPSQHGG